MRHYFRRSCDIGKFLSHPWYIFGVSSSRLCIPCLFPALAVDMYSSTTPDICTKTLVPTKAGQSYNRYHLIWDVMLCDCTFAISCIFEFDNLRFHIHRKLTIIKFSFKNRQINYRLSLIVKMLSLFKIDFVLTARKK